MHGIPTNLTLSMTVTTGTIMLVMQSGRSPERLMIGKPTGSKRQKKKSWKVKWKRLWNVSS